MSSALRQDLRFSVADGTGFSVMVGLGETYLPAFALAIGIGQVNAGWLVSLPIVAGAVLQLVSPWAIGRLRSNRRWVVLCASLQAGAILACAAGAFAGGVPALALFAFATLYWGSGFATGPAWNTWIGTLVPARLRARFFARRSRVCQIGVFAGLIAGGLALERARQHGGLLETFGVIFGLAAAARVVSAVLLWLIREPRVPAAAPRHPVRRAWPRMPRQDGGRLLVYMVAVQASVQVAGPFFTPYMLGQLDFSYGRFLAILAVSFGTKMLVLPLLGHYAHRAGSTRLLYMSGFGIVPLAAGWMVSDSFLWLLGVQVISGAVWAAYELSTLLLLFEHIDESERTNVLTLYNLAYAAATVVGALAGGLALHALGVTAEAYLVLFGLSSVLRLLALPLLSGLRQRRFEPVELAVRPLAVRPNAGSIDAPITAAIPVMDVSLSRRRPSA